MSFQIPVDFTATVLWLSLMAFAVSGGADFGAGVWDLLARGRTAEQQRGALIRAVGPIWEGNEIWLIFLITGTWTAFPLVFSSVMIALFIPLTIGLLGVVMRGAAFAFYSHFRAAVPVNLTWGRAFSVASTATPFLFGAAAAAIASGRIRVLPNDQVVANVITSWTTPFALSVGCFAVALCAALTATFMTVEAQNDGSKQLTDIFRQRALISGAIAAALGCVSAWLGTFFAPYFFSGLTTRALPIALAAVALGGLAAIALLIRYFRVARMLVAAGVALILGAWAVAQLPYLIVPDVPIPRGAAPSGVQAVVLIAAIVSMILVLPPYAYMLYLFKAAHRPQPPVTPDTLLHSLEERDARAAAAVAARNAQLRERLRGGKVRGWALEGLAVVAISLGSAVISRGWHLLRGRGRQRPPGQ